VYIVTWNFDGRRFKAAVGKGGGVPAIIWLVNAASSLRVVQIFLAVWYLT
jgi:hypothetical protein